MRRFLLPDLGEGLEEAQLVQWYAQVGETIALNQPLCQVETAKALVDIPSPFAGVVHALHVEPGATAPVGAPLASFDDAGDADGHARMGDGRAGMASAADGAGPVLVGYGAGGPATTEQGFQRRRRGSAAPNAMAAAPQEALTVTTLQRGAAAMRENAAGATGTVGAAETLASPLARRMAQERGLDLGRIVGTGPGGRIRVEDVEAASAGATTPTQTAADVERISTVGLRKTIAARMVTSAMTIPQFTEYALCDVTALVALRERLRATPAFAGVKLTYLPFFVRALVRATQAFPLVNSRWDAEGNAILVLRAIHVGIATDTPRGLLVPTLGNAQALDLRAIAEEAERLIAGARAGTLEARALSGGTITLTNVGAAGPVDTGAPLINPPEACIVGFGAIKTRAVVVGDAVMARPSVWLSVSCDHRIVDGASAARFMGALVEGLERPDALLE